MTGRANPDWIADLDRTDTLVIRAGDATMSITDEEIIRRFADVYAHAKWEPYWHTLPGDLGERSIDLFADGQKLRRFSYTGVLWENERYESNRTAKLTVANHEWIKTLFEAVPPIADNPSDDPPLQQSGDGGQIQPDNLSSAPADR